MVKNSLSQSESSNFSEGYNEAEFFLLQAGTNSIFKLLQKNLSTSNKKINWVWLLSDDTKKRKRHTKEQKARVMRQHLDENMKGCCTSSKSNQALIFISRHPQF